MELDRARAAAAAELARWSSPADPVRLADEVAPIDVGWAWVFLWNTERWFRSRDPADAAGPGMGPIVVLKASGAAFPLGSSPSFDQQLLDYAAEHGLERPRPLGF